jgi:hypothetical protein
MKNFHAHCLITLVAVGGCTSARQIAESEVADGFYVESSKSSTALLVRVSHPTDGRIFTLPVESFAGFIPARIDVFDAPEGSYVQISGRATVEEWSKQSILLVAGGKPYVELRKSGQPLSGSGELVGPSAMISLVIPTRAEAEEVASTLRALFSISL